MILIRHENRVRAHVLYQPIPDVQEPPCRPNGSRFRLLFYDWFQFIKWHCDTDNFLVFFSIPAVKHNPSHAVLIAMVVPARTTMIHLFNNYVFASVYNVFPTLLFYFCKPDSFDFEFTFFV